MQLKIPKNTKEFYWTNHALFKMRCYGLSAQKVLGVIKRPERKEEGIVKNTIAVMQPINPKIQNGKKIWKQEVWVMYQLRDSGAISKFQFPTLPTGRQVSNKIPNPKLKNYKLPTTNHKLKIISAWRYPGVSPKKNPIPSEILAEIESWI